jgi:hypothetical protein
MRIHLSQLFIFILLYEYSKFYFVEFLDFSKKNFLIR